MSVDILYNEVALRSLKRQQLVQLCKRYGLRASGKVSLSTRISSRVLSADVLQQNVELISRLQECKDCGSARSSNYLPTPSDGGTLTAEERQAADETTTITSGELGETHNSSDNSSSSSDEDDDMNIQEKQWLRRQPVSPEPQSSRGNHSSDIAHHRTKLSLGNDSWELLKGEVDTCETAKQSGQVDQNGSVSSWKSARNGAKQIVETPDITDGSLSESHSKLP